MWSRCDPADGIRTGIGSCEQAGGEHQLETIMTPTLLSILRETRISFHRRRRQRRWWRRGRLRGSLIVISALARTQSSIACAVIVRMAWNFRKVRVHDNSGAVRISFECGCRCGCVSWCVIKLYYTNIRQSGWVCCHCDGAASNEHHERNICHIMHVIREFFC